MSYELAPPGDAALPRSAVGWRLARARAALCRRRVDAALARGADPWSAGELMVRARSARFALRAAKDRGRPDRAARPRRVSARHIVVLVAVVAQLELLLTDPASPVYTRGSDPHRLAEVTSRCLDSVA
jgi:hypothetical protein